MNELEENPFLVAPFSQRPRALLDRSKVESEMETKDNSRIKKTSLKWAGSKQTRWLGQTL